MPADSRPSAHDAVDALLARSLAPAPLPPHEERKALRTALRISLTDAARALAVSPGTLRAWESDRDPGKPEQREAYAYFLDSVRGRLEEQDQHTRATAVDRGRPGRTAPTASAASEPPAPTAEPHDAPAPTPASNSAAPASGSAPTPAPPRSTRQTTSRRRGADARPDLLAAIHAHITSALDESGGDIDAAARALMGDEPNKAGRSINNVMELWEMSRVGTRYDHTVYLDAPDPLVRRRKDGSPLVWEGRVKFTNADPALVGRPVTPLDANAAYLAALSTAHLPVRQITHNPTGVHERHGEWSWQDPDCYGKGVDLAGIVLIDQPAWPHKDLPNPLGDRETRGALWVPTSTYLKLKDAASSRYGDLIDTVPEIQEAYVAPGTDAMFKTLASVLNSARTRAISDGDELTRAYIAKMYSVLVSTMGDSHANKHIRRPDWERIIRAHAFANLWRKAVRAHQAGLTIAYAGGTDELHLAGDVWTARRDGRLLFRQGPGLAEIKTKGAPYTWRGKAVRN
ncbi:hypothetical protein [Streptomyces beihaiensis]|uniref:Uncharacterized protein n=1 Tax=Streptomyces beihaiensis TaxID=2984495 RepID=A0ABT3TWE9_9ACTN|nr:hypothetical protein [Streptomyces beihaiensis]MCX3061374.1 hypothetical protein [Streptomyces beihaiensis]